MDFFLPCLIAIPVVDSIDHCLGKGAGAVYGFWWEMNGLRCSERGHESLVCASHCIKIDQECSQEQRWQDDQPRLGTERAACPQLRPVDANPDQLIDIFQPGNWKAETHPLEEVPADVQPDGKPKLLGTNIAICYENPCKENTSRAEPGCI